MITDLIKPSESIWKWYRGQIDSKLIASCLADKIAGYHLSYSANELLMDLGLLTDKQHVNKRGKKILAHYCHEKYHYNRDSMKIINPTKNFQEEIAK